MSDHAAQLRLHANATSHPRSTPEVMRAAANYLERLQLLAATLLLELGRCGPDPRLDVNSVDIREVSSLGSRQFTADPPRALTVPEALVILQRAGL